jgi:hypothetical protein
MALDKELCAIVALGIDAQGDKQVLDFKVGTSESAEYATRLLRRLVERGFEPKAKHRLLSVTTACTQACWQPKNDCSQCINSTSGRACNAACCPPMRLKTLCAIGVKAPTE